MLTVTLETPKAPMFKIPSHTSQQKVLVVEDDPIWQLIINTNIVKMNSDIKAVYVRSAEEALATLLEDKTFNLIIADHYLAGESTGMDLWKNCRAKKIATPFLLISGAGNLSLNVGSSDEMPVFIQKPFDRFTFMQTLYYALGSEQYSDLIDTSSTILGNEAIPSVAGAIKGLSIIGLVFSLLFFATYLSSLQPTKPITSVSSRVQSTSMSNSDSKATFDVHSIVSPFLIEKVEKIARQAEQIKSIGNN